MKQNQNSLREEKHTTIISKSLQEKKYMHGLLKVSNISCIEAEKKDKIFMRKFMEKVICEGGLPRRGKNLVAGEW